MPASATPAPTKIGVILFPGFQLLDICGPLDVLNILSSTKILHLSILASTLNPVSTKHGLSGNAGSNFGESIVPTHTFANAPDDLEVLILPGGFGARKEENIEGVGKQLASGIVLCTLLIKRCRSRVCGGLLSEVEVVSDGVYGECDTSEDGGAGWAEGDE